MHDCISKVERSSDKWECHGLCASGTGIGGTLSQMQYCKKTGKEEERPIAHTSKSLTKAQRQYSVTRKELLAVVYFVQYFRHYLLGRDFVQQPGSYCNG